MQFSRDTNSIKFLIMRKFSVKPERSVAISSLDWIRWIFNWYEGTFRYVSTVTKWRKLIRYLKGRENCHLVLVWYGSRCFCGKCELVIARVRDVLIFRTIYELFIGVELWFKDEINWLRKKYSCVRSSHVLPFFCNFPFFLKTFEV